ncbi:Dodecaprenyl-phosphate galacturonate synthase [BD1-7 clade bacterium]|uniref:Dodecaprenyl-phosphate galacturonate synthase n=1 Tax=BD1-7 clade bacterium TaxID=2029982 RepID=A0A5S9N0I0_9GAMM|nr:Dodecaprenyl-phosphate galacturonate synthase [BD1-7 clade bacterium]CAA0082481.1 Dodecaprenyl-phosphate galacturonate synthase [BD1-7 clade bacterium]
MPAYKLSVVVPLYNESENVNPLTEEIAAVLDPTGHDWELILINDGSSDDTVAKVTAVQTENPRVKLIDLQRNFGQTAAMQAGIDEAEGDLIVTIDGDLQNDPKDIPRMIDELIERDLDLLQGWRYDRQDNLVSRKIPSRIANKLIQKISGLELHDYGCSLKVYRASIVKQIRLYGEMHRFIPIWMATVTSPHRIAETKVNHRSRQFGESKYGISRTFRVIVDILAAFFFLRFRARPGHFFGIIGLMVGALGGLILTYLGFAKYILGEDIGNRPLLLVSSLLLVAALQFLTTGVLAEMLSRVFFQSTSTRSYVVRQASKSLGKEDDNS